MKKSILIIALCVTMCLVGCQQKVNSDDEQNVTNGQKPKSIANEYYTMQGKDDDIAASLFLGYGEKSLEEEKERISEQYFSKLKDKWPNIVEDVNSDDGDEYYLILPKYNGTIITIHSLVMNDKLELVPDKELIVTENPVLLRCNISDIMPSSQITITYGDKTITFNPFISLKDGKQITNEGIYTE